MCQLVEQKVAGSTLDIAIVACSKGAEVYSILWAIRRARPDLRLTTHAIDISQEIVAFAQQGVYSRAANDLGQVRDPDDNEKTDATWKDQRTSMFERMTDEEVESMFKLEGYQAKVRSWVKDGISWLRCDAGDSDLVGVLGLQDIVVANRFLCHMQPMDQEKCLRNVERLVKAGGHIFVSGVDLDVRTKVAMELGWKPVISLLKEIHEGDISLRQGWPLEYWGLEPLCETRPDWRVRYASVFQIGEASE
jgi:chemotaxis methyl-accepting protein methylase